MSLLARIFSQSPNSIAVVCGSESLTYGELDRRSKNLAQRIAPNERIALPATRSIETIVGILAILRAGSAYVPLDPEYPTALLDFMLTDSSAKKLPAETAPIISSDSPAITPEQLAYILYTSGSTGRPKGVLVSQANLAHSTNARLAFYENPPARFLLLSSFAFDSSVAGIFWTLASGGTLVIPASGEERDPSAIAALIEKQHISHTLCLPALHELVLESSADLGSLRTVIVAGENCPPDLPAAHFQRIPQAHLFNEYGPTEATVWSTVAELTPDSPISIGKAIPGTTIHLSESGEIHIGGPGIASGYLNQPQLSAETFITSPIGERLYKTGDLARRLPNGDLEFLGRSDRQVKIRGHRIELDAIESVLLSHPKIHTAAVIARDGKLVAYVPSIPSDLRQFLGEKLPASMQPGTFVKLATFPLAPNGKIDRKALPSPDRTRPALDTEFTVPRTALETFLAEEWREILQLDRVGTHDKFFDLGGDSLQAAVLASRLQQKLGEPVFIVAIFTAPTIAQLAGFLKKNYAAAISRLFREGTEVKRRDAESAEKGGDFSGPQIPSAYLPDLSASALKKVRALLPQPRTFSHPSRKNPRAIFILAPPRSGTTLLRAMLAQHPALFTASELRLLGFDTLAERRAAFTGPQRIWHRGIIRALAESKHGDEAEAAQIVEECEQENLSTAEFFTLLQQSIAPRELVDKSPSYALDPAALRHAEAIFENAFFIHLARHPCEAITSFAERRMDQVYLPPNDLTPREAGEAVWQIAHQNILDFLATIPADRQAHIRFTDLVSQPREEMEKLCTALNIPFDPALLDPYKNAPVASADSFDDPNFLTRSSIDAAKAEPQPAADTDHVLSEETWSLAEKLGYEKAAPSSQNVAPRNVPEGHGKLAGGEARDERNPRNQPATESTPAGVLESSIAPAGAGRVCVIVRGLRSSLASPPANFPCPSGTQAGPEPIAIIGLAGRFPGASDIEAFWGNLCDGVESIRPFSDDELRASGIDPGILAQSDYVNAGAVPDAADHFAATFFGYTPREAELMDPQQRLFLECAWEAFEHAGCDVSRFPGSIGVFAGLALNSYFQNNLATRPELAAQLGHYSLTIGNEKDFVATRVAHKLGLHGPAIGVQTACSSSLVAVHLACQSLRLREIDCALVGGGRIRVPLHAGYTYIDGGIPSPDGHCRAFDAEARGCVAASGIAAVVLKRLADAQRDGDHIFAVIKSTAINNDGGDKAGFTAPSVEGQAEVISRAHAAAGIGADTISYVEAHGTGTTLGDPIEIAALTKAFLKTSSAEAHCRIGSVKTNIGHLDAGAGVAGLIKTALALDRGLIPPSLHFQKPNPQIDFAKSPFIVNATLTDWPRSEQPRRAGVSSFGIGGTNAHAVLEEAPAQGAACVPPPTHPTREAAIPPQILILSAKTRPALDRAAANLATHLRAHPAQPLADIAFTLQTGRRQFAHRRIVIASTVSEAANLLEKTDRAIVGEATAENPPIAFMFPGQGAQHPDMARELFEKEPVFRDALNRCAEILRPHLNLLASLYSSPSASETMTATAIAQPAIFSIEYALAKLWESRGITPSALLGHSVGEYVAATLAGVFSLEDALGLIAKRGALMQSVPAGAMLAVRLPEAELRPRLGTLIEIAAINSPRLCVVSGPPEAIGLFAEEMSADSIACVPLHTSHAFHSAMMEPVIAPFTELVKSTPRAQPCIPLISTLTGDTTADFTAPEYWTHQLRQPVRFSSAAAAVEKNHILLEVGTGTTLAPLARQSRGGIVISSLGNSGNDQAAMLEALGRLWIAGVAIDWNLLHSGESRQRVQLPTYPFERERYWLEPGNRSNAPAPVAFDQPATPLNISLAKPDTNLRDDIRAVFHELSGVPIERMRDTATFLEIGFDSLFLTQAILAIRKRFGVTIAFRQLFEELATIDALAAFLGNAGNSVPSVASAPSVPSPKPAAAPESFGPFRPLDTAATDLSAKQRAHLEVLAARYSARTAASKRLTQENRKHFADPRSISGFRPFWKELIYPIVVDRSAGSKVWDIDGHEYIDFTMGYGTNLLGHSPRFLTDAIAEQLERGIEIGPQSPIAGEVAAMLCEFSGHDRAAFCNTGSEAVVGAVRVARTVTGRDRIATCSGYHGINDEFLVRAKTIGGERRSVAIAPGIPDHIAREVLAVEYGTPESLEILRAHAHEIAAVLVEPVQSRHPDLQPREFLHELRKITREHGIALVFDEVITGFRCHPGGAQTWFGVRADLVTYGKIIGGGMPIGALCGRAEYMDALDGGAWNFGDDSRPETGVTFFAGTYVRHPLALAASRAMLRFLRDKGPALQKRLNERTAQLVADLNSFLAIETVPLRVESFGSMFIVKFDADFAFGGLLFFHLRERGIHAWDNRLLFLSTAHSEEDLARFNTAFCESVAEMRAGGFFTPRGLPLQRRAGQAAELPTHVTRLPQERQATTRIPATSQLQFSLYFFGNYPAAHRDDKYDLVIESAKFADQHGFTAVWLPERHFHSVGGFSPNAAVMAAALARETSRIQLRAGSVVLPLHHPVRVAEEWSMVDNLSKGRIGISIASGWHPHDFVFAPDAYENRRDICTQSLETIRQLWRGDAINVRSGGGANIDVQLFPMPVQHELPVWLTCVQAESYERAGELGLNILAQLQNQSLNDIAEKIRRYRAARARAGHDRGHVTMLLHTFVTDNVEGAREQAHKPLREYLRSHVEISQRKLATQNGAAEVTGADLDFLLERAAEDYASGKAFIGTPESCVEIAEQLRAIGVDEVGCLIDFGVDPKAVLAGLPHLDRLRERFAKVSATFPLLPAQRGLCLLASTIPDASRAYNETSALELRGPLDSAKLHAALQTIVNRHEALRTSIDAESETLTIHPGATLDLPITDDLARSIAEVRALRFDFARAPLMDARLVRIGAEHHVLLLTFHHVFGNGPSYVALFDDLCALLHGDSLPPTLQLRDYVDRIVACRSRGEPAHAAVPPAFPLAAGAASHGAFWKAQFADGVPTLELPPDHPRPAAMSFRGSRETMRLGSELVSALRGRGAKLGGSLFMTLLSAFQILLHRLSGQDDLVVAVPFSDPIRQQPGGDRLFANTTNVAPLRSRLANTTTFPELLAANRALVLGATEHQQYFFGDLLEALDLPFDASHRALFNVLFNYESGSYRRELGDLTLELITDREPWLGLRDTAMFELYLNVAETPNGLFLRCDFNTDLFDGATIQRWLGHLRTLLEAIAADPARPVANLPLLSEKERSQILETWNCTVLDLPRGKTLHALFEEAALAQPDACAVVDHGTRTSYRELDLSANRLANRLRSLGAKPGQFVGVCMERSTDLIVALLGILKTGAAYVPLDPGAPQERLATMLADAAPLAILCDAETSAMHAALHPGTAWQTVSSAKYESAEPVTCEAGPRDLAYLIYTSGSTGQPKGVAIEHRSTVNFIDWARLTFSSDELAGVLAATSICFDLSIFEIFAPLAAGGSVILAKNVLELPTLPNAYEVTLVNTVPSAMTGLVRANDLPAGVRTVFLAGEPLSESLVTELFDSGIQRVCDGYGPTETGYATFAERKSGESATIGRAIANATAYVLDAQMQPVPIGVTGELFIGGEGVARGYWKRPELTAERFITAPNGERLYRTGDLAHWNADGQLVYRGRSDHQVKMRGYRVELGEIESVLRQHPAISEAAVIAHAAGTPDAKLIAYFVPSNASPTNAELRAHLKQKLPDYMLPGAFVALDRLPLTPHGKLDRRALPEPESVGGEKDAEFVAPRDATENRVAEIWRQVLKIPRVSIHDDFFTIGGHSLTAMQVVARLRGSVLPGLNLHHMFAQPTIAGLVGAVRAQSGGLVSTGAGEREEGVL